MAKRSDVDFPEGHRSMEPMELWHLCTDPAEDVFDTSQKLGIHFCSRKAAAARLESVSLRLGADVPPPEPRRYRVSIAHTLYLPDLGAWTFQNVLRTLRLFRVLDAAAADGAYSAWDKSGAAGWASLKQSILSKGYDGVVYVSELDDSGSDSWIAFESAQIARFNETKQKSTS